MATYCNDCSRFMPLPNCMTNLTVGTVGNLSTAVYVYLKNHTTGFLYRFSVTTTAGGVITFNIKDPDGSGATQFIPVPNHDYELFVTLASDTNLQTVLNVTVNAIIYTCFGFTFENVIVNEDALASYTNQTLKLQA